MAAPMNYTDHVKHNFFLLIDQLIREIDMVQEMEDVELQKIGISIGLRADTKNVRTQVLTASDFEVLNSLERVLGDLATKTMFHRMRVNLRLRERSAKISRTG